MSFLQPLLLFGIPLALIPIVIHLLNRLRYRSVKWGAMMFVLKANRSSTSMARIRQWLILAVRTLAIFALVVALARPLLGGWLGWRFSGDPDTVILLLDRSASMGESFEPGISKLRKAVKLISESGKEAASTSRIVLIDSATLKVHEIPSWSVLTEIDDVNITQTAADFPALYRRALDYMVKNMTGSTEVWAVSDMQFSNWNPENSEWAKLDSEFASLPQHVVFRALTMDTDKRNNRTISSLKLSAYPGTGGKTIREIVFEIAAGANDKSTELPLRLSENGLNRQLTVKTAGAVTKIRHILPDNDMKKSIYGYIALPPDSNPEDNALYFGFAPKIPELAVVISDDEKAASLLSAASAPEGEVEEQRVNVMRESAFNTVNLDAESLIICQVDPGRDTLAKLRSFAMQGGDVIFFPPSTAGRKKDSIWRDETTFKQDSEVFVAEWNHKEGPLADTVSGEALAVDSVKLKKRALLKSSEPLPSAICSDGKPFLYAEKPGKGMIYYCTTLPSETWSNLGEGIVIVPMLRRLSQQGAQRLSNIVFRECGTHGGSINLDRCKLLSSERKDIISANPAYNTGVFTDDEKIIIVNRPALEDNPKQLDESELKALFAENPVRMFREKSGSDRKMQAGMWRLFLLIVIAALVIEAYLCAPGISLKSSNNKKR